MCVKRTVEGGRGERRNRLTKEFICIYAKSMDTHRQLSGRSVGEDRCKVEGINGGKREHL